MKRSARITIHPEALQHNLNRARQLAPKSKILAVIKANAYGHGSVATAGILYPIADAFAVSCVPEAIVLREAGIDLPITILQGHQTTDDLRIAAELDLRLTIHDDHQLILLDNYSHHHKFSLNLKIDSGMHRLGFHPERTGALFKRLQKHIQVKADELILMTHFSCADDLQSSYTEEQITCFEEACLNLPAPRSIANSAGILGWSESHTDWVRPGIMLYGSSPFSNKSASECGLQAAMTFEAPVISVHPLKKGDSIGYAATWQCPKDMKVAVIACGYADGYPRHAGNGTPVWINGSEAEVLGRISMDMIVINADKYDKHQEHAIKVGDIAELWGKNLTVDRIANAAETIGYEILCNAGNIKS